MDKDARELFEVSLSETKSQVLATTENGISVELGRASGWEWLW